MNDMTTIQLPASTIHQPIDWYEVLDGPPSDWNMAIRRQARADLDSVGMLTYALHDYFAECGNRQADSGRKRLFDVAATGASDAEWKLRKLVEQIDQDSLLGN